MVEQTKYNFKYFIFLEAQNTSLQNYKNKIGLLCIHGSIENDICLFKAIFNRSKCESISLSRL